MSCDTFAPETLVTRSNLPGVSNPGRYKEFTDMLALILDGDVETFGLASVEYTIQFALALGVCCIVVFVGAAVTIVPCICVRCFCCRHCCRTRDVFVETGYPRSSCIGWQVPCCVWAIVWFVCVITVLIILTTFNFMVTEVDELICLVNSTLGYTREFLLELEDHVQDVTSDAANDLDNAFAVSVGVLQLLRMDFMHLDSNASYFAGVASSNCTTFAASVNSGASGLNMNCTPVDETLDTLTETTSDLAANAAAITDFVDAINDQRSNVEAYLDSVDDIVVVLQDFAAEVFAMQVSLIAFLSDAEGLVDNATAEADAVASYLIRDSSISDLSLTQAMVQGIEAVGIVVLIVFFSLGATVAAYPLKFRCCKTRLGQVRFTQCTAFVNKSLWAIVYLGLICFCAVALVMTLVYPFVEDTCTTLSIALQNASELESLRNMAASSGAEDMFAIAESCLGPRRDLAGYVRPVLEGLGIEEQIASVAADVLAREADIEPWVDAISDVNISSISSDLHALKYDSAVVATLNASVQCCCAYDAALAVVGLGPCSDADSGCGSSCFNDVTAALSFVSAKNSFIDSLVQRLVGVVDLSDVSLHVDQARAVPAYVASVIEGTWDGVATDIESTGCSFVPYAGQELYSSTCDDLKGSWLTNAVAFQIHVVCAAILLIANVYVNVRLADVGVRWYELDPDLKGATATMRAAKSNKIAPASKVTGKSKVASKDQGTKTNQEAKTKEVDGSGSRESAGEAKVAEGAKVESAEHQSEDQPPRRPTTQSTDDVPSSFEKPPTRESLELAVPAKATEDSKRAGQDHSAEIAQATAGDAGAAAKEEVREGRDDAQPEPGVAGTESVEKEGAVAASDSASPDVAPKPGTNDSEERVNNEPGHETSSSTADDGKPSDPADTAEPVAVERQEGASGEIAGGSGRLDTDSQQQQEEHQKKEEAATSPARKIKKKKKVRKSKTEKATSPTTKKKLVKKKGGVSKQTKEERRAERKKRRKSRAAKEDAAASPSSADVGGTEV